MNTNFALATAEQALADADQKFFAFNSSYNPATGAMGALESPRGKKLFETLIAARMHRDSLKNSIAAWNR